MKRTQNEKKGQKRMRIKLILPHKTIMDQEADKISAPGKGGSFQILPKHIDIVWSLEPGILTITSEGKEIYFAIHQGVLMKEADTVYVSSFQAIRGESLEKLHGALMEDLKAQDEREQKAREILVKLETDTVRRFMEIEL